MTGTTILIAILAVLLATADALIRALGQAIASQEDDTRVLIRFAADCVRTLDEHGLRP